MVRVALCLFAFLLTAVASGAHPHVWIDMRSSIDFNAKGAVDAIDVTWTFDEFYSQFATDGIDKNNNKKFDPPELQDLANVYIKNLKAFGYFMYVETGGKVAAVGTPTNARATFDKGQLTFMFRLPFATPVDAATVKLRYASFDPTYFVDIAPVETRATLTGTPPKGCSSSIRKVDSTRAGALNLAQSVKMIAPTTDVLNATNAAVIDVTCTTAKAQ